MTLPPWHAKRPSIPGVRYGYLFARSRFPKLRGFLAWEFINKPMVADMERDNAPWRLIEAVRYSPFAWAKEGVDNIARLPTFGCKNE